MVISKKKKKTSNQKHFFLIRGLIREAAHWGKFPLFLKKAFPKCKVTTLDIPGAGIYNKETSFLSIEKMVSQMRPEFLANRKEKDDNYLIAISLGGMIAAEWIKDFPDDFQKAILINTSYSGFSNLFERLKPSALLYLLKVPFLQGSNKEARILSLVSNHREVFTKTLDLWYQIQELRPVSLNNTLRQLVAAARFRIGNFIPNIPILILGSTLDRMVNIKCSRTIAAKWNLPIVEHPTAGHDLSADDPDWIVKEIKSFV